MTTFRFNLKIGSRSHMIGAAVNLMQIGCPMTTKHITTLAMVLLMICSNSTSSRSQDLATIELGVSIAVGVASFISSAISIFGGHDDSRTLAEIQSLQEQANKILADLQNLAEQLQNARVAINNHTDEDFKHYIITEFQADINGYLSHLAALKLASSDADKNKILKLIAKQDVPTLVRDARRSSVYEDSMFAVTSILALSADDASMTTGQILPLRHAVLDEFVGYLDQVLNPDRSDSLSNRYTNIEKERIDLGIALNTIDATFANRDVYNWSGNCCGRENESYGDRHGAPGCLAYMAEFIFIAGDQNAGYSLKNSDPQRRPYKPDDCGHSLMQIRLSNSDFVPVWTGERRTFGTVSILFPAVQPEAIGMGWMDIIKEWNAKALLLKADTAYTKQLKKDLETATKVRDELRDRLKKVIADEGSQHIATNIVAALAAIQGLGTNPGQKPAAGQSQKVVIPTIDAASLRANFTRAKFGEMGQQ
jgi:hypothetical protein